MIEIWERTILPDAWVLPSSEDPRLAGLVRLANLICDADEQADGRMPEDEPVPAPLELAALLRDAAEQIECFTGTIGTR